MKEQSYNISLQTPLGKKQGKMHVKFHGENIDGNMELLKQNMPFSGSITVNGE